MPRASIAIRRALVALLALVMLAACQPNGSAAPSAPAGSGAACATAPSVPDDLAGWGPPATAPELTPYLITSPVFCGPTRMLFTVLNAQDVPAGRPDLAIHVDLFNLARAPEQPIASVDGTFIWAIEDERGIYATNVMFPEAGRYGAAFSIAGGDPIRLTFDVQPTSPVVQVGDPAPSFETPTVASVGGDVTHVSTDGDPDPAMYETSLDDALAAKEPIALIFATPKFCTSAQCGPTLDRIKPFVARYPSITFINVEPYKLKLVDGTLQADLSAENALQVTPITDTYTLVEPSVFVIDREGVVRSIFDLIFSDEELTTALNAVK